jgi:hypothetical protein
MNFAGSNFANDRGISIIEVAVALPVILVIMMGIFDLSRIAYNKVVVRVALTEALKKSQGDLKLKANVWSLEQNNPEVQSFISTRQAIVESARQAIEKLVLPGTRLIPLTVYDQTSSGESSLENPVAYLPPGYSGFISELETPIHNPFKCSPLHIGEMSDNNENALFKNCSGGRVRQNSDSLADLESKFPRVLATVMELDTLFAYGAPTATPTPALPPGEQCVQPLSYLCYNNDHYPLQGFFRAGGLSPSTRGVVKNAGFMQAWIDDRKAYNIWLPNMTTIDNNIKITDTEVCVQVNYAAGSGPSDMLYSCREPADCAFHCSRLYNGCFDAGTKILLANGQSKPIEEIIEGDKVLDPITKKSIKIRHIYSGSEKEALIEVVIATESLRVTRKHPFITKRGLLQAHELSLNDLVLTKSGAYESITSLRNLKIKDNQIVYNLELDIESTNPTDRLITVGSIVTPDIIIQRKLEEKRKALLANEKHAS